MSGDILHKRQYIGQHRKPVAGIPLQLTTAREAMAEEDQQLMQGQIARQQRLLRQPRHRQISGVGQRMRARVVGARLLPVPQPVRGG